MYKGKSPFGKVRVSFQPIYIPFNFVLLLICQLINVDPCTKNKTAGGLEDLPSRPAPEAEKNDGQSW